MSELDAYKTIGIHPIDCNCISCKPDRYEMPSMPTAPQPEVLPRRGPNAIMEELARRGLRDTAPQPPNEQPVQTLARLLEEAGAVPVVAGIPLNTTLEERIALLLERIAALEAQLAEAQHRADEYEERWLGYPKAEEPKVKRVQELQRKRAAEESTPEDDAEYTQLLEVVRSFSPRMNDLFTPVGSMTTEEIIDALERGQLALLDRIAALDAELAEAQARLAMAVEALSTLAVSENYGTHRQFVMYLQVSEFARKALVAMSSAPAVAERGGVA